MDLDVTYSTVASNGSELDLVDLRRALGALTQTEAAQLLEVLDQRHAGQLLRLRPTGDLGRGGIHRDRRTGNWEPGTGN